MNSNNTGMMRMMGMDTSKTAATNHNTMSMADMKFLDHAVAVWWAKENSTEVDQFLITHVTFWFDCHIESL